MCSPSSTAHHTKGAWQFNQKLPSAQNNTVQARESLTKQKTTLSSRSSMCSSNIDQLQFLTLEELKKVNQLK
eukprot:9994843-Karenia_brevis.AAC.1